MKGRVLVKIYSLIVSDNPGQTPGSLEGPTAAYWPSSRQDGPDSRQDGPDSRQDGPDSNNNDNTTHPHAPKIMKTILLQGGPNETG